MEQDPNSPIEAKAVSVTAFFDEELRAISDKMERAESTHVDVDTNGTVRRRQQEILHFGQRQIELEHNRAFVLEVLAKTPQTSETSGIGYYFVGKLDEIDLTIERIGQHRHGVIIEEGTVKGKEQELEHLRTIRSDMLRIGNHVLSLIGEPPLVDKKDSAN